MEDKSFALELLRDMKKSNKRMFIIWIITFVGLLLSIGYIIYLLNDIGVSTESIDIQDVENINGSNIEIGDELWAE